MLLTKEFIGHKFVGDASNYDFTDGDRDVTKVVDILDIDKRGRNDYVDVLVGGYIAYMAGETCELIGFTESDVTLLNQNNEDGFQKFTISKKHFDACFVPSCV